MYFRCSHYREGCIVTENIPWHNSLAAGIGIGWRRILAETPETFRGIGIWNDGLSFIRFNTNKSLRSIQSQHINGPWVKYSWESTVSSIHQVYNISGLANSRR